MSPQLAELIETSKGLSVADRKKLANAIWESIPLDDNWQPSGAALAEIHKRMDEHDRDPGSSMSWDEMQQRLSQLRLRKS